jgi:hypothetical protein
MRVPRNATIAVLAAALVAGTGASGLAASSRPAAGSPSACRWGLVTTPRPDVATQPSSQSFVQLMSVSALPNGHALLSGQEVGSTDDQLWVLRGTDHGLAVPADMAAGLPQTTAGEFGFGYYEPASFDSASDGWQLLPGPLTNAGQNFDSEIALANHWSGGKWSMSVMAPSNAPATVGVRFNAVAAISPDDAWAAGAEYAIGLGNVFGADATGALFEHWDGTSWQIIANPAAAQPGSVINGLAVVSPTDIWAVGQQGVENQLEYTGDSPFAEHWDGHQWSNVPLPAGSGGASFLMSVSADQAGDAWAVGYQTDPATSDLVPLVEHWDGESWSTVVLPATGLNGLVSVYAASPQDIWAVDGGAMYPTNGGGHNAFLHWNGSAWSVVTGPGPAEAGLSYEYLALGGEGPADIWAAGSVNTAYPGGSEPLVAHLTCSLD